MYAWPTNFQTKEEALQAYNDLGLPHKIMFKIESYNNTAKQFSLVCVYSKTNEKKKQFNGAVELKKKIKNYKCPVAVHFKLHDLGNDK
jgi:hypothetical protein